MPEHTSIAAATESARREPDVVDALLTDALAGTRPASLLVVGAGGGVAGLVAASEATSAVVADRSVVHAQAASEALSGLPQTSVVVSDGASHLDAGLQPDVIAIRLPREKGPGLQLLWDAYELLPPGGKLYIAGALRDGAKSYFDHARELFGGVQPLIIRKGARVGLAIRDAEAAPTPEAFASPLFDRAHYHSFNVEARGQTYEVHSRPGVFAWDRLDGGTRALLDTMQVGPSDRALDLGCGYGLVGLVAANLAPEASVTLVDADIGAVEAARRTLAANGASRCEVFLGDGAARFDDEAFDLVAVNPPFHLDRRNDYRTAHRFVADAERVLASRGVLYLVANRFLPYERVVLETFGNVAKVHDDGSFKVLRAQKGGADE